MEGTVMYTELLRDLPKDIMARDLLSLDMVTAQASAIITEVLKESKDMAMEVTTRDLLSLVTVIIMDMDNLMSTRTVIIIMDLMDMRLSMIIRRDLLLLNQVMGMEDTAMSIELLRDLPKDIMARDLLSLDMVTAQVSVITTEVPRESKDMAMEAITRDLLSLVMAITMDMDNLMFTRTVIIIMDLTDMRLSMITRRDLLRLDMAMVVIATSMSTGLTLTTRLRFIIHKHITMDMARGLLSLDMAPLMSMLSRRIMDMVTQSLMNMDTTFIRDQLSQDMVITMDMDILMFTRTAIIIMDLMDMRLIMIIRRDLLMLSPVMDMEDTAMSTEPLKDLLKDIMARDLLSLDMVTVQESAITKLLPISYYQVQGYGYGGYHKRSAEPGYGYHHGHGQSYVHQDRDHHHGSYGYEIEHDYKKRSAEAGYEGESYQYVNRPYSDYKIEVYHPETYHSYH